MNQYNKLTRNSIEFGLIRMNNRILLGAVIGIFMMTGMFVFAPGDLASGWQYLVCMLGLIEVTLACWLLRIFNFKFIKKPWGVRLFRTIFIVHSNLYALCFAFGISYLLLVLEGRPYSISVMACLLFACAVVVSSFAFDLFICVNYLVLGLAVPTYVSLFHLKDGIPIAVVCVMSILFFSYLAYSIHKAEVETLYGEETIRRQSDDLRVSRDTIAASNELFQNTLNSIDEIFLTLDREGICFGNISQKTDGVLGMNPTGRHFTEILRMTGKTAESAKAWFKSATSELHFFQALQSLGPAEWIDTERARTFRVQYFSIQTHGEISAVIMTLSDVTAELAAKKTTEAAEARSALILAVGENRVSFGKFLQDVLALMDRVGSWPLGEINDLKRELHTLKGAAYIFEVRFLAKLINELELNIKEKSPLSESTRAEVGEAAISVAEKLRQWIQAEVKTLSRLRIFATDELTVNHETQQIVRRAFAIEGQQAFFDRAMIRLRAANLEGAIRDYENHTLKTAARLNKQIAFNVTSPDGAVLLIDETALAFAKSLVHLFNNAVDHAIETPSDRVAAGKAAVGSIRVQIKADNARVTIHVEDDGAGIDEEILRQKAVERGIEVDRLSQQQLLMTIFDAGVSTRKTVSDISGHGIGLNALMENVERLGGTLTVESRKTIGSRFTIQLPVTEKTLLVVPVNVKVATRAA